MVQGAALAARVHRDRAHFHLDRAAGPLAGPPAAGARAVMLALALVVAAGAAAATAPTDPPNELLIRSARTWEVHEREDLARIALEKLVAARPDRAAYLLLLGELELRSGELEAARRVLARLEAEHGGEEETRTLATEYRVAARDRLRLASLRRMVEVGSGGEIRAALDQLFPGGAPRGALGLEYYRLLAQAPDGWAEARQGLEELAAAHPDDPRYQLALARHLGGRADTAREALALAASLRGREDVKDDDVAAVTDSASAALGTGGRAPAAAASRHAASAPGAAALAAVAARTQRVRLARLRILLERRTAVEPADAAAAAALAALVLSAPQPAAADLDELARHPERLGRAATAAAFWRDQGRRARRDGALPLAEAELEAALALDDDRPTELVGIAARLAARGQQAIALAMLESGSRAAPDSDWLFASELRLRIAQGDLEGALARLDERAAGGSDAPSAARLRAQVLDARAAQALARGDGAAARADLTRALELAPDDPWIRYRLARLLLAAGEPTAGRALMAAGRAAYPADAELAYAEALYLESIGDVAAALADLASIPPEARTSGMDELAARLMRRGAAAAARPSGLLAGGLERRTKPGTTGISQLDSIDVPFEWRHRTGAGAELWAAAEAVRLDAGRLPFDVADLAVVGSVYAHGLGSLPGLRRDDGRAAGVALGLGYRGEWFAADVGTTPLGFALKTVVGGLKFMPRVGRADVSLEAFRRPVTSSVLSYAGRRDPVTGTLWGGVVEDGIRLSAGRYESDYSVAGSLKWSALTGTRVLDNRAVALRLAADRQWFVRPGYSSSVGVTLNYWSYAESLLNYTFGSGGYYSPQSYLSLALPLEISGRTHGVGFRVRAAGAYSRSRTKTMAFYPNDPALMVAALAQAPIAGVGQPYFDGGRSSGVSFSFYGALERALTRSLVLGLSLDLDRTDYYHPTALLLYLRHPFGAPAAADVPPRPPLVYSRQ